jgi:signal transduction histidine kinase
MIIALTMGLAAVILGIADFKTVSTRWAMGLTFFAGLAGFTMFWADNTALMFKYFGFTKETQDIVGAILSGLSHYFIPYTALMFGISYSKTLNPKYEKLLSVLLLVPMIIMFLFYPTHDYHIASTYKGRVYYGFFSIWAVPYLLISCAFQIYAYFKEDIPGQKKQRFIFCLISIPGIVFTSITTYLLAGLPVGKSWKYWDYNIYIILYMFVLFLYSLIKHGVLGIKFRIEKQNLNNMMNVLNSGMKIMSHSLKNEINKISICMTNIKFLLQADRNEAEIYENIQLVSESLEYLSAVMKRIQKSTINSRKFEFIQNNLAEIIETALKSVTVFLKTKNIRVCQNVSQDILILCDRLYMQEVFLNICQNSIEAMDFDGSLIIETSLTSKGLVIVIKDNGVGIAEKDLSHVVEPFFTTKDKNKNFGLGLSYCYNVLKEHEASMEIWSEKNIGTTVSILFPKNRIVLIDRDFTVQKLIRIPSAKYEG